MILDRWEKSGVVDLNVKMVKHALTSLHKFLTRLGYCDVLNNVRCHHFCTHSTAHFPLDTHSLSFPLLIRHVGARVGALRVGFVFTLIMSLNFGSSFDVIFASFLNFF